MNCVSSLLPAGASLNAPPGDEMERLSQIVYTFELKKTSVLFDGP